MPSVGDRKMRYPGNDPENGPACWHKWDGSAWKQVYLEWGELAADRQNELAAFYSSEFNVTEDEARRKLASLDPELMAMHLDACENGYM